MENRRRSSRIPISREVYAYHNNVLVIRSPCSNLSPFGMFLKCGYHFFDTTTELDVTFTLEELHHMELFNIPAIITHIHRNGMGLKFNHKDRETPQILERMLKAA